MDDIVEELSIADRFRGPPHSGNGGYVCGRIARHIEGAASVRLFVPPPLRETMQVRRDGDAVRLMHGSTVVGEGRSASLTLEPPMRPALEQAVEASRGFAGFVEHWFPGCFVCGPHRGDHDGLRIFPGTVGDTGVVAAPWTPDETLASGATVDPAFSWAALDCPGAFAVSASGTPVVLGQLTARIDRSVKPGERYVVLGWPLAAAGRKHFAGTAILNEAGESVAVAEAVWIEVPASAFEAAPLR
jgi:hypothetical protein